MSKQELNFFLKYGARYDMAGETIYKARKILAGEAEAKKVWGQWFDENIENHKEKARRLHARIHTSISSPTSAQMIERLKLQQEYYGAWATFNFLKEQKELIFNRDGII